MSNVIDRRVVEMGFENAAFERGVQTSLNSIENLKRGLNFDGVSKSLTTLASTAKSFSLFNIEDSLMSISNKFSNLGIIGIRVLTNLTDSAMRFAERLVKSVTVEPLKKGLQEYETQLNAIQTVLANTSTKGTTLNDVNAALDELNAYSDKTIYNFTEMTRNIGTFTAAGIDLKTSTAAIKGIANLAAVSGSNSQQASVAMYQLSQALASGTVKLIDWNSVVNAGMGGEVFQNALKDTARVHGVAIDQMLKTEGSFRETLHKGWLTSEILTETLSKFTGDLTAEQIRSMGYTEDQVQAILKMGVTANDAATKVKTFTQLWQTLGEAIQSGWSQSWRIIIGDFEEAKTFMTEINNVLGNLVSKSSESRNNLLKGWKDLGGREDLIGALRNSFSGLMKILEAVQNGFKDIFPPILATDLANISSNIRKLSLNMLISSETSEKIRKIFRGVASVFDILGMGISAVARGFGKLITKLIPAGNGIFDFAANLGDSLTNIRDWIKENDTFNKIVDKISNSLSKAAGDIGTFLGKLRASALGFANWFSEIKDKIGSSGIFSVLVSGFQDLVDSVKKFLNFFKKIDTSGVESFGEKFKDRFSFLEGVGDFVGKIFDSISKKFESAIKFQGKVLSGLGQVFGKIGEAIANGINEIDFSKIDFNKVFDGINAGLIGALILTVTNFVKKGSGVFDGITGIFKSVKEIADSGKRISDGVKGLLDGVRGSLEAWQRSLNAGILLTIAISIAILAASLISLSMVDSKKLTAGLIAITTLFADLFGSLAIFEKVSGSSGFGAMGKAVAGMVAISLAVLLLSEGLKKLAEIDPKRLNAALASVTVLSLNLAGTALIMSKNSVDMTKGAIGMIAIAVSINILSSAVEKLGELDPARLTNGLIGVGVLCTELALFMKATDLSGMGIIKAVGILILAAAINIMALAVSKFGAMDIGKMVQGLEIVGLILAELAAFTAATNNSKGVISTAIGLTILGGAMLIFSEVLTRLGDMSWDEVARGLSAMAGALTIVTLAVRALPKNMIVTSVALAIVGGALLLISEAVKSMGGMEWDSIGKGIGGIAAAMTIIAIGMYAMQGALPGAAAMLVVSFALSTMVPVLALLGSLPLTVIGVALLALAGVFAVLGLAGLVLAPVVPVILALAGAMLLFGIAAMTFGVGMTAFSTAMAALAVSGAAGAGALILIITSVINLLPLIAEALAKAVISFANGIRDGAPAIGAAILAVLTSGLNVIMEFVPNFVTSAITLLETILATIAAHIPQIVQSGFDIVVAFLKGVANNIGEVVLTAIDIVVKFLEAIAQKLPDVIQAGWDLIIAFVDGLADSIADNLPRLTKSAEDLGKAIIDGMVVGFTAVKHKIINKITALGMEALAQIKKILGIESPSKEFMKIFEYVPEGGAIGIENKSYMVTDAVKTMGESAISSMSSVIGTISDWLGENMDLDPTIRPVLDLSLVAKESRSLTTILGRRSLSISASVNEAQRISNGMNGSRSDELQNGTIAKSGDVQFTQNNYSPKALSAIEIYRQTQNQLRLLKGLTG